MNETLGGAARQTCWVVVQYRLQRVHSQQVYSTDGWCGVGWGVNRRTCNGGTGGGGEH